MKERKSKTIKRVLTAFLGLALAFGSVVPAAAATKAEVQNQIAALKSQQGQLENKLSELKKNKKDTEDYIKKLDKEIKKYRKEVEEVSADINKTDAEIKITEENLAQAREDEKTQYDALKKRIKTMYEAGEESYVQMLLNCDDIKSLLNDQEYSSKINEYDRELLTSIQQTKEKIADYEKKLQEKKELQEAQKEKLELEKASLEKIANQKQDELISIGSNIDSVKNSISVTQAEIDAENNLLAEIVERERREAEEAARRAAEEEARRQQAAAEEAARAAAAQAQAEAQSQTTYYEETPSYNEGSEASYSEASYDDGDSGNYTEEANNDYAEPSYEESSSSSSSSSSSTGNMIWPVASTNITSSYGGRDAPTAGASSFHRGVDIAAEAGSSIMAADNGTVSTVGYNSAMGNYVVVDHDNGVSTIYEHCSSTNVSEGQNVSQGETIASVGSTGVSTGAHLHFGVTVGGDYENPLSYVSP